MSHSAISQKDIWKREFRHDGDLQEGFTVALDRMDGVVRLRSTDWPFKTGAFDIATPGVVATEPFAPGGVKSWLSFESYHVDEGQRGGAIGTTVRFRVSVEDGVQLYWTGTRWAVPPGDEWNTEAELADNLPDLQVTDYGLSIVARLATTDRLETPELYHVKVLFEYQSPVIDDLIGRTLARALKQNVRGLGTAAKSADGLQEFDLSTRANHKITSVVAVYDKTTDPKHRQNILRDYTLTGEDSAHVRLTTAPTAGDALLVFFEYSLSVAVVRSQNYRELDKVPTITIDDVRAALEKRRIVQGEHVLNKRTNVAWALGRGRQDTFDISLKLACTSSAELKYLSQRVADWVEGTSTLTLFGTGRRVTMRLATGINDMEVANQESLHEARIRVRVLNVVSFLPDSVSRQNGGPGEVPGVKRPTVQMY